MEQEVIMTEAMWKELGFTYRENFAPRGWQYNNHYRDTRPLFYADITNKPHYLSKVVRDIIQYETIIAVDREKSDLQSRARDLLGLA